MSDGALRIPITGDASQFKATLAEIESSLKYFKEKLKSAKGDQVAKINFTIAGLEESKTAITTFGKFAEGTLGALNQQISELNRKKLTIQADAAALAPINQELDRLIKKRDELNKAGLAKPIIESVRPAAESIAGLRLRIQELNDLKILIDPKLNPSALAKINQEIDGLEAKLDNLDNLGTGIGNAGGAASKGLKKLEDQSKQSRIAVTNLALVLQDLPFGFIAIQNNLPNLQSSFANLKTTSDGTKNAFKAFAGALAGPGGFFLAFSAVTGAITYAIQEYGSLGAAIKELLGTTTQLDIVLKKSTDSLQKYNKQLETTGEITGRGRANASGEIIRIQTLASAVRNVTLSEEQRANALKEIQKLDPETLKNIDLQKNGYGDLDKFVKKYTDSLIANAVAQEYLSKVVATTTQINQQSLALQEIAKGYADIAQRRREAEAQPQFDPATGADLTTTILGGLEKAQQNLNERFFAQAKIVSGLYSELNTYKSSLESATLETLNFFKATKKSNEGLKKLKEFDFTEITKKAIPFFDLLAKIDVTEKDALKFFDFDIYKEFAEQYLSENDIKKLKKLQEERIKKVFEIRKYKDTVPQLPDVDPISRLQGVINKSRFDREALAKDFEGIKQTLQDVFFTPVSDLFDNFFETGKFAFDEFGKSILKTIKSLVSRIIATGIINLLANILLPGGARASASLGGASTGAGGGILGAFGAAFKSVLGIGKIANPNFGGVQGGGMQLAGEVVFRQRGSDLIGVINRTNGTINRVG